MTKFKAIIEKIKKFWPWILGVATSMVIMGVVYYIKKQLMTKQAELTKLRTAAEQSKVKALADAYRADLDVNNEKREQLKSEAFLANAKATKALEALQAEEEQNKKAIEQIKDIKSWDELDAINTKGRT